MNLWESKWYQLPMLNNRSSLIIIFIFVFNIWAALPGCYPPISSVQQSLQQYIGIWAVIAVALLRNRIRLHFCQAVRSILLQPVGVAADIVLRRWGDAVISTALRLAEHLGIERQLVLATDVVLWGVYFYHLVVGHVEEGASLHWTLRWSYALGLDIVLSSRSSDAVAAAFLLIIIIGAEVRRILVAHQLTLWRTRLNIEQIELIQDILRELRQAYAFDDWHFFDLTSFRRRMALSLAIVALLKIELSNLYALQVQLALALLLGGDMTVVHFFV